MSQPAGEPRFTHEQPGRYSPRQAIRQLRSAQLDCPTPPTRSLVVCTNPRTGSWALCTALAGTGRAGYPSEYLIPWDEQDWSRLWGTGDFAQFLAAMLLEGTSPNGVFAIKVMWGHVGHLQARLAGIPGYQGLAAAQVFERLLPGPAYVWLSRRDTLRQAVSHALALRTGVWAVGAEEVPTSPAAPADQGEVDPGLVRRLQDEIEEYERRWAQFFAETGQVPLRLWYEELQADLGAAVRAVLHHLGVGESGLAVPAPGVRSQSDATNERWVAACLAERVVPTGRAGAAGRAEHAGSGRG